MGGVTTFALRRKKDRCMIGNQTAVMYVTDGGLLPGSDKIKCVAVLMR